MNEERLTEEPRPRQNPTESTEPEEPRLRQNPIYRQKTYSYEKNGKIYRKTIRWTSRKLTKGRNFAINRETFNNMYLIWRTDRNKSLKDLLFEFGYSYSAWKSAKQRYL